MKSTEKTESQVESSKEAKALLSRNKVHLDDVFKEYIGEGGRYQIFLLLMLSLNVFCQAAIFGDIIWVTDLKPHWCALPEGSNPALYNLTLEKRLSLTVPWIEKDGKLVHDSCHRYKLNYSTWILHNETGVSMPVEDCSSWEFDTSELRNTIVEKVSNRTNIQIYIQTKHDKVKTKISFWKCLILYIYHLLFISINPGLS